MRILAIDPGLTIGYAMYQDDQNYSYGQSENPEYLLDWIDCTSHSGDIVLIENYISAGHLTSEAKHTIKLVGLYEGFSNWIAPVNGITVKLVSPQTRLSGVAHATRLIGDDAKNLHRNGRDAIAALAHAVVYARKNPL